MQNLTFENLLSRAKAVFYDVWIEEPTPEEVAWNKAHFEKYPQKYHQETWPEPLQPIHAQPNQQNRRHKARNAPPLPEELRTG